MSASAQAAPSPWTHEHSWRRAFQDLTREHGFEPLRVEGKLPEDLSGTLYRNGPALFGQERGGYGHWFDGDGAVSATRFRRGAALGAVRVVQSWSLQRERAAGKLLYAGYGTRPQGLLRRLRGRARNAANTSVIVWNGRLFALWEGGRPTELRPADLSTLGETDLEGVVAATFSAHPHRVRARRASYNFGVTFGRKTELTLYELPDAGPARRLGRVPLPRPTMIHDFIATPKHLVFFAPPLNLNVPRLLLGLDAFADALSFDRRRGTEVIVVPIDAPDRIVRFEVDGFYQWHFAQAFERGRELVVDYVRLPDFASHGWLRDLVHTVPADPWQGRLHRAVLDLDRKRGTSEERWDVPCEFPRVGRAGAQGARHVYVAAAPSGGPDNGLFASVGKVDLTTGRAQRVVLGEGQYPSEPVFVPSPNQRSEDDGYLLTLVYDSRAHQSHVAVLRADALEAGPLARAHYDHHLPFTFHGNYVPDGAGEPAEG